MIAPRKTHLAIPSDDVTLAGDAFGQPSNLPVVLLHGGGQTRHSWRSTAVELARSGWRAITVDLRGHGDSGWVDDGHYDLGQFASDVENVVDHVGVPPVLVGASLGGSSSLAALKQRPDLARGLVLVDVSPFVHRDGVARVLDFMCARPEGFETLEEAADAVASYLPQRPRPHDYKHLRSNLREIDGRLHWHWDPALVRSVKDQAQPATSLTRLEPLTEAALTLPIPTLLIRGAESDVLTVQDAKRFLTLVPHAEFATIPDAGHMVTGDDNNAFGAILLDFLNRRIRSRLID